MSHQNNKKTKTGDGSITGNAVTSSENGNPINNAHTANTIPDPQSTQNIPTNQTNFGNQQQFIPNPQSTQNIPTNQTNVGNQQQLIPNPQSTQNIPTNQTNFGNQQQFIPNIREQMVKKAGDFLLASSQNQSKEGKIQFLRSKGLTDFEIKCAIERASMLCQSNPKLYQAALQDSSTSSNGTIQTPIKSQGWFRRLFGPIAYALAIAYIGYQIYKKYIESWLFGKQKSPLEKRLEVLESSMQKCLVILEEKATIDPDTQTKHQRELNQIQTELKSIKSLLLNRSQFPPAPTSSSIPQWQLLKSTKSLEVQQNLVNSPTTSSTTLEKMLTESNNCLKQASSSQVNGLGNVKNANGICNTTSDETELPKGCNMTTTESNDKTNLINN